jgi:predicted DNA-binding ArsR family transcriptional regulator
MRVRRTNEQLRDSLWRALSSKWQTVSQVSEKARMDIRTTRQLIKDYLEEFKNHLERSEAYIPSTRFQINDRTYYVIEVAERDERIIAVRLVAVEELSGKYGIALSQLNG